MLALLAAAAGVSCLDASTPKLAQFSGDVRAAALRGDELSRHLGIVCGQGTLMCDPDKVEPPTSPPPPTSRAMRAWPCAPAGGLKPPRRPNRARRPAGAPPAPPSSSTSPAGEAPDTQSSENREKKCSCLS